MRIFLTILFVVVCIVLSVAVLLQEGKSGLGSLAGGNNGETFWGKNKGRSAEGKLAKITKILAVVFFLLAMLLNLNLF